jgi:3'-phosphoadenosine 5'-phosphosulfate sulfotransferase (PAPS reductase)/FAD synthetase
VRAIDLPPAVERALERGGTLAISVSGGKDSQALINALGQLRRERGWTGPAYAVHADLGRAEWPQSIGHCRKIAAANGLELVVVRRPQGDLVQQIEERADRLAGQGKAPWPDAKNRYCTSDQKRAQIAKVVRNPWPTSTMRYCTADQKRGQIQKVHRAGGPVVVAAMGFRADESAARAKRERLSVNGQTTAKALGECAPWDALVRQGIGQRVTLDWLPIHDWTVEDVWRACGTSGADLARRQQLYRDGHAGAALDGWPAHPAYVYGNQRVSCALCVLGSKNDIVIGARHNPDLLERYVAIERRSGYTFRVGVALDGLLDREADREAAAAAAPRQLAMPGLVA